MKIININNSFAMPSFGVGKKIKGNKMKKNVDIRPIISNILPIAPTQRTSQILKEQFETHNQINLQQQILPQQTTKMDIQNSQNKTAEIPPSIVEIPFEDYVRFSEDPILSSPTFNPGIYNEDNVQTQKEILQNKILENRTKYIQKYNLEANNRNEIDRKRLNIALFLSKFLQILKKLNSTQIKLIRKQIAEILDTQKVLFEDILQTSIQLYHQYIYQKRKQNPDYELSMESFDDNRILLNKTQYGKLVSNSIVEKINSPEFKKNLKVMEHIFSLDINKGIQNVFNVFNDIFLYMNQMFDYDIEYRKKYLDIIAEAVILNSGEEESLPQLTYSSYQNPNNHINILQPSPPFETDFEVDINNLELPTNN